MKCKLVALLLVLCLVLWLPLLCWCSFSVELNLKSIEIFGDAVEIKGEIQTIGANEYNIDKFKNSFCGYLVFPQHIQSESAEFFAFSEERGSDRGRVLVSEIYLSCTYSDEIFSSEIKRLSEIKREHADQNKPILYSEELFNLPSYVAIYNDSSEFEYAIVNEKNLTIYYVYLFAIEESKNIVFDMALSPHNMLNECSDIDPTLKEQQPSIQHGKYNIYKA